MSETTSEIAVLRAALAAAEARASAAEGALVAAKGELTQVQAIVSASEDMIRHLRLQIAKLRREQYGHGAERHARLIEQLEMQLEDIETDIADDRAKTEATGPGAMVAAFEGAKGTLGDRLIAAMQAGIALGGEAGPVHSAGLKMVDKLSWPVADLRCDWIDDGCPIDAVARAWEVYRPQMADRKSVV